MSEQRNLAAAVSCYVSNEAHEADKQRFADRKEKREQLAKSK